MLTDKRLAEIREACRKASQGPWEWEHDFAEIPTDDPELNKMGFFTLPDPFVNIRLVANGKPRFRLELADDSVRRDIIWDLDFIRDAREWIPELLGEIERLRALLGRNNQAAA